MTAPIAVLMAAYNAKATLRQALDSVLASTVPCDVFLVDDGSRVPVAQVIAPNARVEIIRLEKNQGLAAALNAGLARILALGYPYVARMDADDVCYPDRLAKQIAFLEQNPQIGMVGGGVRFIDDKTGEMLMYWRAPLAHADIRKRLFFNNAFSHPSLLVRADVLARVGPYSCDYPAAEDYEFMRRITRQVMTANVPDYLLDYRISATGVSISKRRRQLLDRLRIQLSYFEPREWRAWAGALATLAMFVVPMTWINAMKVEWRSAPPPAPPLAAGGPNQPAG